MTEHRIRLRGGWQWSEPRGTAAETARVALPIDWPPGLSGRVLLVRPFGRPPIDPSREVVRLRLQLVPGLVAVRLNDREVPLPSERAPGFDLSPPGPLLVRNVLALEVDAALAAQGEGGGRGWGEIALIVQARD